MDQFLSTMKWNDLSLSQYEMIRGHFEKPEFGEIIGAIDTHIQAFQTRSEREELSLLESQLQENPVAFSQSFMPGGEHIRESPEPLFHQLNPDVVRLSVGKWQPSGITSLQLLLKYRYLQSAFAHQLAEEIVFLNAIEEGIAQKDLSQKTLSNHLLEKDLLPTLKECKNKLTR